MLLLLVTNLHLSRFEGKAYVHLYHVDNVATTGDKTLSYTKKRHR